MVLYAKCASTPIYKSSSYIRYSHRRCSLGRDNFIAAEGADNLVFAADEGNAGADSYMRFKVDGAEKLRITSGGSVGIGTLIPQTKFEVSSATGTRIRARHTNVGGGRDAGFDIWSDDSGTFAARASLVHSGSAGRTTLYAQNKFNYKIHTEFVNIIKEQRDKMIELTETTKIWGYRDNDYSYVIN